MLTVVSPATTEKPMQQAPLEDIALVTKGECITRPCRCIKILNIYVLNIPKYINQNISFRQKINKETLVLNDTLYEENLINIHRKFHREAEYTYFSNSNQTFSG